MLALIKQVHVLTVVATLVLFTLRFVWKWQASEMLNRRWVKIVPHVNDTLLLLSGVVLMIMTASYPFTAQGSWMTEKLLATVVYIILGVYVLSKRQRAQSVRCIAFIAGVACFYLILYLTNTKLPLLLGSFSCWN